jgi:hypothetical protein
MKTTHQGGVDVKVFHSQVEANLRAHEGEGDNEDADGELGLVGLGAHVVELVFVPVHVLRPQDMLLILA